MKFTIAYDIPDNKRRRKVQKYLYSFAYSYQKSVVEVDVSEKELKKIITHVNNILEKNDRLVVFSFEDVLYLGEKQEIEFVI